MHRIGETHVIVRGLLLAALAIALAACARPDRRSCEAGQWRTLGEQAALAGRPPGTVIEEQRSCARHGVSLDEAAWQRGFETGLAVFCTPERARAFGLDGGHYAGQCADHDEAAVLRAWLDGVDRRLDALALRSRELEAAIDDHRYPSSRASEAPTARWHRRHRLSLDWQHWRASVREQRALLQLYRHWSGELLRLERDAPAR